jgi:hypothetical protein
MSDYVRTQGGQTVHRAGCVTLARATTATPWPWADGKTPEQIRQDAGDCGLTYRWCRYCFGGTADHTWTHKHLRAEVTS